MLKILSWNVNNFAGSVTTKIEEQKRKEWNILEKVEERKKRAKVIAKMINREKPDIIILQEFEVSEGIKNVFFDHIQDSNVLDDDSKYKILFPKGKQYLDGATIIIVNKNKINDILLEKPPSSLCLWARWIEVTFKYQERNITLLGIHRPLYRENIKSNKSRNEKVCNFNKEFASYIKNNRHNQNIIIGDFNAAKKEDRENPDSVKEAILIENKEFLNTMTQNYFFDAWKGKQKSNEVKEMYTYYPNNKKNGRRLDYAFISKNLNGKFNCWVNYYEEALRYSDHKLLVLNVEKQCEL